MLKCPDCESIGLNNNNNKKSNRMKHGTARYREIHNENGEIIIIFEKEDDNDSERS